MSYDPNSPDAMFSRILAQISEQAKATSDHRAELLAVLHDVRTELRITNGRVNGLERWRDVISARVAVIASVTSFIMGGIAWAIQRFV